MSKGSAEALLRVDNLTKHYPITQGIIRQKQVGAVRAVDGISFEVRRGETLGLVGESGCGKSTTGRLLMRLEEPTEGSIRFDGCDWLSMGKEDLRRARKDMQIVFQDPFSSLNPRMTVGEMVGEPLLVHGIAKGAELERRTAELLGVVGLDRSHAHRYPHEFSGGQRQRIGVARALALNPKLIILDEPVSALDVSVQAQVINLLQDLQQEFGLTYIFIAHDLAVVRHISNRVAVMYLGKIVELAQKDELCSSPLHPYTEALLSAVPIPDPKLRGGRQRIILEGDVPSPVDPPSGCRFHTRCRLAQDICSEKEPVLEDVGGGHMCACWVRGRTEVA
ncbi:MAG TPA: dipeptide ABC transporter ATP-binding protein [Bacillota bacterium]|nr:dipeptide ABC transporter ATP-binding protein [Bacillota bacterium]HOO29911.1 dipeptide ABC transporter ATP-binding protein [Bacillota bacterium]